MYIVSLDFIFIDSLHIFILSYYIIWFYLSDDGQGDRKINRQNRFGHKAKPSYYNDQNYNKVGFSCA